MPLDLDEAMDEARRLSTLIDKGIDMLRTCSHDVADAQAWARCPDGAAAMEAVRARRTQISMLQSLLKAHQSEAEFARTGPR